jgi:8-oxo-dGTP pyrophosphatase MutT (NUDIX family)
VTDERPEPPVDLDGPEYAGTVPADIADLSERAGTLPEELSDLPEWLHPLAAAVAAIKPGDHYLGRPLLRRPSSLAGAPNPSAVLILFADSLPHGPDVLITERSATMRSHAGQAAFPGGRIDPLDSDNGDAAGEAGSEGPVRAALREAREEAGVDPAGVRVFGELPELYLPPSDFLVTPVLAWWRTPGRAAVTSPEEVAAVHRVPVAALIDPANRYRLRHPSGYEGPAFLVDELLVWGFTAGVLDAVLRLAGWERPWEPAEILELPLDVREIRRAHGPA